MEIRDPVHGSMYFTDAEVAVIDTPEFQRLRAIKQLGYAEFSFPGGTHNRYLHSIGVGHLAGQVFDSVFRAYPFTKSSAKNRLRNAFRLAALLHDVGHGPLSHTTEQVMPPVEELEIHAYQEYSTSESAKLHKNRKANHEDYTIKLITDSEISQEIKSGFQDILPIHVACLIDKTLKCPDDFFFDNKIDLRPILSQMVSSEMDVDRMDYLERDSYFCGTNYGKVDLGWLIQNLTFHIQNNKMYLALNRKALYSFDDFLLSRHHMHLMVYSHHKSIIFEEMLNRYLTSPDCTFILPAKISEYVKYNDYKLHEHLSTSKNPWAQRIAQRKPFKMIQEIHSAGESKRPEEVFKLLEKKSIEVIWASSQARLSKYHSSPDEDKALQIFVLDQYDRWDKPAPIGKSTEIFQKYEHARVIDRLYVAPEDFKNAEQIIANELK